MGRQRALATSPDRFLPQNLPDGKFRELLRLVWLWRMPNSSGETVIQPLIDYVIDVVQTRLEAHPSWSRNPLPRSLLSPTMDTQVWVDTMMWVGAALTAEWGHREGFVGPPDFDLANFDLESRQAWGAPRAPGAMALAAAPNNPFVAQLAEAMDAVFKPERQPVQCAFCDRNDQFRDLAAITEAIAAADRVIGYMPTADSVPPPWRLAGAMYSLAMSKHYTEGTEAIREHCYHVAHGGVNEAQHRFARDQQVKECGPWCDPMMAILDARKWSVEFRVSLEESAEALVRSQHLQPEDIAVLYTAAVERMAKEATDFDSVHIAHSVCHFLMDAHAPNPARH